MATVAILTFEQCSETLLLVPLCCFSIGIPLMDYNGVSYSPLHMYIIICINMYIYICVYHLYVKNVLVRFGIIPELIINQQEWIAATAKFETQLTHLPHKG